MEELGKPLVDAEDTQPVFERPSLLDGKLEDRISWYPPPFRSYSRRELLADQCVNFAGAGLAWLAGPVPGCLAWTMGATLPKQCGFWAFAAGLIAMLNCSAINHFCCWDWRRERLLGSIDRIGIDMMILGACASLLLSTGCVRVLTFIALLGAAGLLVEAWEIGPGKHALQSRFAWSLDVAHTLRYLYMGWMVFVLAWPSVVQNSAAWAPRVLLVGGFFYTVGVPFVLCTWLEFHQAIWHCLVMLGTGCVYVVNVHLAVNAH